MSEPHYEELSASDEEVHEGRSPIAIVIAYLCIFFGFCMALSLVFTTGVTFFEVKENSSVPMAIGASAGMFLMGLPFVGILTYGITLRRRQLATADEPHDPFAGLIGWINIAAGLAFSCAMLVGLSLGAIVTLVERDWESFFILAGATGFLGPLFVWLFRKCLDGLRSKRATEDGVHHSSTSERESKKGLSTSRTPPGLS